MIELSQEQQKKVQEFIVNAFDIDELTMLSGLHLGEPLENLVATRDKTRSKIVFDLIQACIRRGEIRALLRGVRKRRPDRDDIIEYIDKNFPSVSKELAAGDLISDAKDALKAIVELKENPRIFETVGRFKANFRAIEEGIFQLTNYKQLHELLHFLQRSYIAIQDAASRYQSSLIARKLLTRQTITLKRQVNSAKEFARNLKTQANEIFWIEDFEFTVKQIEDSIQEENPDLLNKAISDLRPIIVVAAEIDRSIVQEVQRLPLNKLKEALKTLIGHLEESEEASTKEKIERLKQGCMALTVIRPRLYGLVYEHNLWQWLDKELTGIETNSGFIPEDKIFRWNRVKERLLEICKSFPSDDWSREIKDTIENWEAAAHENNRETCEIEAVALRALGMDRFFDVDRGMRKMLAENLLDIASPLKDLLETFDE